jgi:hypothetical protein
LVSGRPRVRSSLPAPDQLHDIFCVMPTCNKCSSCFPNRKQINGRCTNLSRRRYCLECSPFGQHNTRRLHGKEPWTPFKGKNVACKRCGRVYIYDKRLGHNTTECNSCVMNKNRRARKIKAVEYKGGKCERCGYSKCLRALEFHHRDKTTKDFQISHMCSMSWERLKNELDKCDLVCSNCHQEEEDSRVRLSSNGRMCP